MYGCPPEAQHSYIDFAPSLGGGSRTGHGPPLSIQKQIYQHIAKYEPNPWVALLSERLPSLFPEITLEDWDSTVGSLSIQLQKIGPHCANLILKTLTNSDELWIGSWLK